MSAPLRLGTAMSPQAWPSLWALAIQSAMRSACARMYGRSMAVGCDPSLPQLTGCRTGMPSSVQLLTRTVDQSGSPSARQAHPRHDDRKHVHVARACVPLARVGLTPSGAGGSTTGENRAALPRAVRASCIATSVRDGDGTVSSESPTPSAAAHRPDRTTTRTRPKDAPRCPPHPRK